jgi:hypothetical protein
MKPQADSHLRVARPSRDLIGRLVQAGGTRVPARNPYWDEWGITIADPDGYRRVLSSRSWPERGNR